MPRTKLPAAAVERVKPPLSGRVEYFDATLPGFALRVTDKGSKSWVAFYRIGGRQRRYTLGSYPAIGLIQARDEARKAFREVARGDDPALARLQRRARPPDTIDTVVELFIERYAKRQTRSWKSTEAIFRNHVLQRWRKRPLESITRRDVVELLDELVDLGFPVQANRVLAHIRKLFGWAMDRGIVETTPAARVKAPAKEIRRDRVLSDVEVKELWNIFDNLAYPFGPMFKLLLLTGQRRDEVARMRWCDLDLESLRWTIPKEVAKSNRTHVVPLSGFAVEIIGGLPRFDGPYVFSTTAGEKPVSGYSRAKQRAEIAANKRREIDGLTALPNWRIHDMRRTAATGMTALGISGEIVGRILNHAPRGITAQVYDRHSYIEEKAYALNAWAQKLESIVRPGPDQFVILRA